ncbi:MAG TPA: hypothetical protein PKJ99_09595 [Thermoanaerobaculales bacterium]|nr:hypothetical protein [Thermoanaerobaculales bacterium]
MSWQPLWPKVESVVRALQPEGFRWPRANARGWIGPIHSPLREDRNPSFSLKPDSAFEPGGWCDHATGERGSIADLVRRLGLDPSTLVGSIQARMFR